MRLFKIVIFCLKLVFFQYVSTNNFFKTTRNLDVIWSRALYPNFWRYIRIIFCFTKEEAEVRKQELPFVPAHYIRSLRRYTAQQIGFWKNPKGPTFYNFKKFEFSEP